MGDQVIDVHQSLLVLTKGEGCDDVEIPVQDLVDAMIAMKDENTETTMDDENMKKPEEEEEAEGNVECRFCHQEDFLALLEAPCLCNGTLKYVHWDCVQRWSDAKGNITCEICHQPYQPNYAAMNPSPPDNTRARGPPARPLEGRFTIIVNEDCSVRSFMYGVGVILVTYLVLAYIYIYCT